MYRSCRAFATRVAAWLRQVVNQLYFLAKFALAYFALQLLQQKYFASRLVCTTCVAALAALPLIGHLPVSALAASLAECFFLQLPQQKKVFAPLTEINWSALAALPLMGHFPGAPAFALNLLALAYLPAQLLQQKLTSCELSWINLVPFFEALPLYWHLPGPASAIVLP